MSEKLAFYDVGTDLPKTLRDFKNLRCALPFSDPNFQPPSPVEVKQLIQLCSWSQSVIAGLLGISFKPSKGSTTIHKWCSAIGSKEHRQIPYSAWRLLLLYANVVTIKPYFPYNA